MTFGPTPALLQGTWLEDGNCYYHRVAQGRKGWFSEQGYQCVCTEDSTSVEWRADGECVTDDTVGAATLPAICRYHDFRNPEGSYYMG